MVNRMRTDGEPMQPNHRICQRKDKPGWWRIVGSIREQNGRFVQADVAAGKTVGASEKRPKDEIVSGSITSYGDWCAEHLDIGEPTEPVASEVRRVAPDYCELLDDLEPPQGSGDTFSAQLGRGLRRLRGLTPGG